MSQLKISIAGATGKLGSLILAELLRHPHVLVHAICREPTKIPAEISAHPQLKIFQADCMESEKLQKAVSGTSVCICCYMGDATVLVDGQRVLIDACIAENVPRYIASDYSFDYRGFKLGDVPLMDFHFHVQSYLDEKEAQGLIKSVHILNGAFMEVFVNPFFGAYDGGSRTIRTWGNGDEVWELTTYADTAKYTAMIAIDQNATGFFGISGDRKTARQVAALHGKVYGQPLNVYNEGSLDQLIDGAQTIMSEQPENFFIWVPKLLNYYMLNGSTLVTNTDREKAESVQPSNFEQFLRTHQMEALPTLVKI